MTTTFEDNQEVTLTDLNSIAVDLGATTFSAFSEEKFGVDKLNEITADLVTAGILRTEDDGSGNLDIGCKPTFSDGVVTIGHGTVVFESGAKVYIESEELEAAAGTYIYAYNDILTGRASLVATQTEPTDGDFVMLCWVSDRNALIDKRTYSKAKVTMPTDGMLRNFSCIISATTDPVTVDVGCEFSYVFINSINSSLVPSGNNMIKLSDGESVQLPLRVRGGANSGYEIIVSREGQAITFDWWGTVYYSSVYEVHFAVI